MRKIRNLVVDIQSLRYQRGDTAGYLSLEFRRVTQPGDKNLEVIRQSREVKRKTKGMCSENQLRNIHQEETVSNIAEARYKQD